MNNKNRTITNEQFFVMTTDDKLSAIYHCMCLHNKDNAKNKEDARRIIYQLVRITFRLLNRFELNLEEIYEEVIKDNEENQKMNERIHQRTSEIMKNHPDEDCPIVWTGVATEEMSKENKKRSIDVSEENEFTPESLLKMNFGPSFKVNTNECDDKSKIIYFYVRRIDKDELIPWISIENPQGDIDRLVGKDEVVINNDKAVLLIGYPLHKPVEIEIHSNGSEGFRRGELSLLVSEEYKRIYREEEGSAIVKTIPPDERRGLYNRDETDGKYGIWGHDIGDLDLSSITVHQPDNNGMIKLSLGIDS